VAVLGRLLVSSAERLDLPDLLSLDSYAAGDWKYFLKGLVGDSKPYILKGFDVIDPSNAIGTQSCSIRVADSVVFYPGSSSGGFFHGLPEGNDQAAPLVPELRKNAVNYVYLTFSTFNTSVDTRAFWDPDKDGGAGGEFTQDVNTESVLKVDINVSTGSFPANTIPIAKITVGPVVITAIEDARDLMFRLGSGGISPNPFNQYAWRSLPSNSYERAEPPTQMLAGGTNPFQGADKNILTLKEWMDAIMSKLRELGGTTYWYDDTSSYSLISNFVDSIATAFKSKGRWIHDIVVPGLLTWTEDLNIKVTADPRTYIIRSGNKTLSDEQVMYVPMIRNQSINSTDESVQWVNGQNYVNTVGGAVGLFANLSKGDYIKKANDTADKWLRVEEFYDAVNLGGSTTTAALARSIRLSSTYLGATLNEKGRYDKGVYASSDVIVSDRNQTAISNIGGNFHWLAMRSDTIQNVGNIVTTSLSINITEHDGSTAKVTSSTSHGLIAGDRVTISGSTNFNGTYQVEVESSTVFYITKSGGPFADESSKTARYATVTTVARSTNYGLQLESANHNFKTDDTITITGTTNYNGTYQISVTANDGFTIPVTSANTSETVGTATLPRMIVRTEGAVAPVIQGQSVDIGGSSADNLRQYIGMQSFAQTAPDYNTPSSYNTLNGMANYNSTVNENITARVAKLTAMMADKAQDKTIQLIGQGYLSSANTGSGPNQLLTFVADANPPPILNVILPGSANNGTVGLTGTLTLAANQIAYIMIDRNNTFTVANLAAVTVANISSVSIGENTLVLATRLSGTDVWLWNGQRIPNNQVVPNLEYQGQGIKVTGGGTLANVSGNQLTFTSDLFLEKAGLNYTDNTIPTSQSPITFPATNYIAYVMPNYSSGGGNLVVTVNTLPNVPVNAIMIARREGNDIIIGSSSMRLITGESKKLYAGSSDQTTIYTGQPNAADSTPTYTNVTNGLAAYPVVQGNNLTEAIGQTVGNVNTILTALDQPAYDEFREIVASGATGNQLNGPVTNGTIITLPVNTRLAGSPQQFYIVGKGTLEIYLNGQILQLGESSGWQEVGSFGSSSSTIQINQQLEVLDFLSFRIDGTGGPGSGGGSGAADDNFFTLPTKNTASDLDYLLIYDIAGVGYKKQTRANFLAGLNNVTNVRAVTADWTLINSDDLIVADTTSTLINLTLPSSALNSGKKYLIKKANNAPNDLVLQITGGDVIDGSSTFSFNSNGLTNFGSLTLISDGAGNWWLF
jgi:hypothetical protein